MRLYQLVGVVAFALLACLPAPAAAENVWFVATTAEGCTISWLSDNDFYSQATFERDLHFSWSGTCKQGQPASGQGRLSQDIIAGNAGGTPPQHFEFEGTMVDGVFDGDAKVDFYQEGQLIWSKIFPHNMGCSSDSCIPRPRRVVTAEPVPSRVASLSSSGDLGPPVGNNLRPSSGPGPIMEEPWNGVGKPPKSPVPAKNVGANRRAKDKPVPHLSDDRKVLNEILRLRSKSPSRTSEAAAVADFRKSCAHMGDAATMAHYENNVFLERRFDKNGKPYSADYWRKELHQTVESPFQCALQTLLRHSLHGVPGFEDVSTAPAPRSNTETSVSEADARYEADLLEYEQKLAAQQKAVAEYEAAQRQVAADNAAAAAAANAAQLEFARQQAAYQADQDRYAREQAAYQAQLAGQPVPTGGSGTLPPLSSGGQTPPSVQQGSDSRIIASDGKSAMDCVKLVELTKTDSNMGGGGRVLSNQCSDEVEIGWCYTPGDCETETGSSWTVQPGRSWPVSAEKQIRWVACHGKNTASFEKGSYGLRYICKAPAN